MIQSTSGSPWDLVMGWVCLVRLIRALWGRFRAARKPGTVVWTGGWYFIGVPEIHASVTLKFISFGYSSLMD